MSQEQVTAGAVSDAEEHTLQPLLLHSLHDIREVWLPLLELADIHSVSEVGTESGVTTQLLVERLRAAGGGRLVVVDPDPGVAPEPGDGLTVDVVRGYSPQALEGLSVTDAYFLDGDHNYWTVVRELAAIERAAEGRATFPLVLMNDVSWPWARRDLYYAPDRLPADGVHPHSFDLGVTVGRSDAVSGGFRGQGAFAVALREGGPRNGVLTAVEDFLVDRPDLEFLRVAAVFGLGIILDRRAPWAEQARQLLAPYAGSPFIERLERNRVELYLRVLELQDLDVAEARARQRDWARLDEQRSELAIAELEVQAKVAEAERRVAEAEVRAAAAEAAAAALPAPSPAGRPGRLLGGRFGRAS